MDQLIKELANVKLNVQSLELLLHQQEDHTIFSRYHIQINDYLIVKDFPHSAPVLHPSLDKTTCLVVCPIHRLIQHQVLMVPLKENSKEQDHVLTWQYALLLLPYF